ncbi:MAG: serine hydrolase [Cyanobacteriota bacterium]
MVFYSPDPAMGQHLEDLVRALEQDGRPGLAEQLSITWLRYPHGSSLIGRGADLAAAVFWGKSPRGASWNGSRCRYPASVVKLVYLVAAEAWLQADLLPASDDLTAALADMIQNSSNDATGLVVDLLSGTTSGPRLPPEAMALWHGQRQLVNQWLRELGWHELEDWNACQKTWGDGPQGRERESYGSRGENRNRLSSDGVARLLHAVMASAIVSPPACQRMRALLARSLDAAERAADRENQVDGFLGEALPDGARLWSKAGWMSQARHDAAYVEIPRAEGVQPQLLVVFSEGERCAGDERLLPELGRRLLQA